MLKKHAMRGLLFKMSEDKESIWSTLALFLAEVGERNLIVINGHSQALEPATGNSSRILRCRIEGSTVILSDHRSWGTQMQWFNSALKFPKCHHIEQP